MTNEQAAQILRDHNEWRRDRSEKAPVGMPKSYNPTLLGQAIDVAVKALEQPEPTELERFMSAVELLFPWREDCHYMAVDESGEVFQFSDEPTPSEVCWFGLEWNIQCGDIAIPAGIDWRDCLIERT